MADKPELLAPAGDSERLKMSVLYGADAVYLAGTSFGMRSFAGNFTPEELKSAVSYAHAHRVKVHVTVNTMPRSSELSALPAHLELLESCGVDALIIADLGVFRMAERYAPHCQRHVSTQVSIANYACANAWYESWAQSASCWRGSFPSKRSAPFGRTRRRRWRLRPSPTAPCAYPIPGAVSCRTT